MDRLKKPKDFLEKLRLSDSDYQDSGMINHIADLLERYHTEQLRLGGVSDLLIAWQQFKEANWWESDAVDVEKVLMDKFQAIYGR